MSVNPFRADPAIRARFELLDASVGTAVREAIAEGLGQIRRDVAGNNGGVLRRAEVDDIRSRHELSIEELLLLARPLAESFARPPISGFHVGAVGLEAETGNLIFGGNLEFVDAHIGNTVHGEGFVFARAFSRGTSIAIICIGEAHPCAHCRQFLSEFAGSQDLLLIDPLGHRLKMGDLYPWPFDPDYLGERGIVAGATRNPNLRLAPTNGINEAVTAKLIEIGRQSYTPYGKSPTSVVLTMQDGALIGGTAIESVAFNPTMGPLQAAMIDVFAHGYATDDITSAAIATARGAKVDYVAATRGLLDAIAPDVLLRAAQWA